LRRAKIDGAKRRACPSSDIILNRNTFLNVMSVRKKSKKESNSQDDSKLPSPCVVGRLFPSTIGQEKKGESSFLEQ
jgi:hypothetical protein